MKKKKTVRLTEQELHRIIRESTKKVLNEYIYGSDSYGSSRLTGEYSVFNDIIAALEEIFKDNPTEYDRIEQYVTKQDKGKNLIVNVDVIEGYDYSVGINKYCELDGINQDDVQHVREVIMTIPAAEEIKQQIWNYVENALSQITPEDVNVEYPDNEPDY